MSGCSDPPPRTVWILELSCCGHADGYQLCESYEAADEFREQYLDAHGHDRAAILAQYPGPVRLGFHEHLPSSEAAVPDPMEEALFALVGACERDGSICFACGATPSTDDYHRDGCVVAQAHAALAAASSEAPAKGETE